MVGYDGVGQDGGVGGAVKNWHSVKSLSAVRGCDSETQSRGGGGGGGEKDRKGGEVEVEKADA